MEGNKLTITGAEAPAIFFLFWNKSLFYQQALSTNLVIALVLMGLLLMACIVTQILFLKKKVFPRETTITGLGLTLLVTALFVYAFIAQSPDPAIFGLAAISIAGGYYFYMVFREHKCIAAGKEPTNIIQYNTTKIVLLYLAVIARWLTAFALPD